MKNAEIIKRYEADFERCSAQVGDLHKEYTADKDFFLRDKQWTQSEIDTRNPKGRPPRPTLTNNKMRQFIMRTVNDHKQSRMGIRVSPGGGGEDKELAQVRQGIVRAIERNNGGQVAYNQAKLDQVTAGFGAWRLYADYLSPTSFEQEPKFLPIWDASKLYWPVADCMEGDYSDMDCAIIREDWSKARFKSKLKIDPDTFLKASDNPSGAWGGTGPCVSEYYFKDEKSDTLVKGKDGKEYFLSEVEAMADGDHPIDINEFLEIDPETGDRLERPTTRCEIWWAKLAGKQVIGKPIKLPGQWIPVFIADGRKVVSNGKIELWSLGRPAKDAQRSHNYASSAEIERLALSPKAPFVVPFGGIPAGEKTKWETLNTGNWPFVQFNAYKENTTIPLPPPHRTDPIQSDPGFLNLKQSTTDEMKAAIGLYDASIGNKSNETSGVAIESRKREGDTATFDFSDNFGIAVTHCGRVLNEWIPAYIDTARQVRMLGEDDKEKVIRVNDAEAKDEDGKPYHYPMDEGKFDISIQMGPSASTKRMESTQAMQEFYQAYPPAAAVTGHLFAKQGDWQLSDEFAKILKKLTEKTYPGVLEPEPGEQQEQQGPSPEVQAMQQQMQEMQQELQQAQQVKMENQAIKADRSIQAQQLQLDAKRLEIEQFKADTERMKAEAEAGFKSNNLLLAADKQAHTAGMDGAKLELEHRKTHMDHQSKKAALDAKPTGAIPGKKATTAGVKRG